MAQVISIRLVVLAGIVSILRKRSDYCLVNEMKVRSGIAGVKSESIDKVADSSKMEAAVYSNVAKLLGWNSQLSTKSSLTEQVNKDKRLTLQEKEHLIKMLPEDREEAKETMCLKDGLNSKLEIPFTDALLAVDKLANRYKAAWVKTVKAEYEVPSKNGNLPNYSEAQLKAMEIEMKDYESIVRHLGLKIEDVFTLADKEAKVNEWDWPSEDAKQACIMKHCQPAEQSK